jgi:hypothetical protein
MLIAKFWSLRQYLIYVRDSWLAVADEKGSLPSCQQKVQAGEKASFGKPLVHVSVIRFAYSQRPIYQKKAGSDEALEIVDKAHANLEV